MKPDNHRRRTEVIHPGKSAELDGVVQSILSDPYAFKNGSETYNRCKSSLSRIIEKLYADDPSGRFSLGVLGDISLPAASFGNIDTRHLFGLDELILFVFYWINRNLYVGALDLGANIGLHTIFLSKFGYQVQSFEPDPDHVRLLNRNIRLNHCEDIEVINKAVYLKNELKEFTRIKNNSTGSHISGAKRDVYGPIDTFFVECVEFREIIPDHSALIKMDIEGAEGNVICSTEEDDWSEADMMIEVGSPDNADKIYRHLSDLGVNMFPQKNGWAKAKNRSDLPISHLEGSLFLSRRERMPW
jgi:FkbM family methyltransferase